MKAVIFLGPSLPVEEARQILDAVYLPPARQTDLLTATVNRKPDVIGLIDGVFLQSLSVWHKEILYALDEGIQVYGSSSMGALRAAETAIFGMVGIGEVYRQYASGALLDDDEVALTHAPAELGYKKISEPMVNVRATFQGAMEQGILNAGQLARITAIAKQIYFAQRTFPLILQRAAAQGIPQRILNNLAEFVSTNYVDVKRRDAIELLRTIQQLDIPLSNGRRQSRTFAFKRSTAFETLYTRDREVEQGNFSLPLELISNYVALHDPSFDELNFHAMNRIVVLAFAEMIGLEAREEELRSECTRFRKRHNLEEEEALTSWLTANHIDEQEFQELMSQLVLCRRMHRWFLIAMWMGRTSKVVLDELRLSGQYPQWVGRAAAQERLLKAFLGHDSHTDTANITLQDLAAEHSAWSERKIDIDLEQFAEESGFHTIGNLKLELTRASIARQALLEMLAGAVSSDGEQQDSSARDSSGRGDE